MRMRIRSQRAISAGAMAREVICDYEGRRRPVSFYCSQSDSAKEAHDNLFSAVKTVFSDIISWKEKDSYFLQVGHEERGICSAHKTQSPL